MTDNYNDPFANKFIGYKVALVDEVYGTNETGILVNSSTVGLNTYGLHTIKRDNGTYYRTEGVIRLANKELNAIFNS